MLHSQFPVSDFHPLNVKFKWFLKNKKQRWIFLHNLHSHADWLNVVAGSSLYLNTTWKHLILHLQGAHPRGGEGRHDCSLLQASHLIRPGFHHFPKSAHLIFHSGGAQGSCQGVVLVGNGHQQAHPWLRLHWQGQLEDKLRNIYFCSRPIISTLLLRSLASSATTLWMGNLKTETGRWWGQYIFERNRWAPYWDIDPPRPGYLLRRRTFWKMLPSWRKSRCISCRWTSFR